LPVAVGGVVAALCLSVLDAGAAQQMQMQKSVIKSGPVSTDGQTSHRGLPLAGRVWVITTQTLVAAQTEVGATLTATVRFQDYRAIY
jgi:hypothetical protein